MLGDKRFLRTIKLSNLLSFGPDSPELELQSLNVLIGPNGSGKSNLIEVISLLQAAPRGLFDPVRKGGWAGEWMWKGSERRRLAELDVTVEGPRPRVPLRHRLVFDLDERASVLCEEELEGGEFFYRSEFGSPVKFERRGVALEEQDLPSDESILSQRKDPKGYPEITYLGREYGKIRLFREWDLGRNSPPRRPQPADLPSDFLEEDAINLALVMNDLEHRSGTLVEMERHLKNADEAIERLTTRTAGNTIQIYLRYRGLTTPVPATRLSDGTVRYLCLLAILLHPDPPPLVCIEEPELGLHPDLMPGLADLLIDASHRMQLIVTTHSDVLVDGLTKTPEAVVICEKRNGSTEMRRPSSNELSKWLKEYGLGQLWRSGEIGGNRW